MQVRQGDVLLEEIDTIPPEALRLTPDAGRNVLAVGEGSGHAHVVDAAHSILYGLEDLNERFLAVLKGGELLTHEEHAAIHLPAGAYRVIRQREYSPPPFRFARGSKLARLVEA